MKCCRLFTYCLVLVCVLLSGCVQVKAWEKGTLAKNEMAWDPDPLAKQLKDHVYFSKEGIYFIIKVDFRGSNIRKSK